MIRLFVLVSVCWLFVSTGKLFAKDCFDGEASPYINVEVCRDDSGECLENCMSPELWSSQESESAKVVWILAMMGENADAKAAMEVARGLTIGSVSRPASSGLRIEVRKCFDGVGYDSGGSTDVIPVCNE